MGRVIAATLMIAVVSSFVGCLNRNRLPAAIVASAGLDTEPRQTAIVQDAFEVQREGVDYRVQPLFDYELTGLVVSYKDHDASRMHRRWNDHLNVLDLCVVWGETAVSGVLHRLKFWNGEFTCNVQTSDMAAWSRFDLQQLANNHLLSNDDSIRRALQRVSVGDQIRLRGQLAEYSTNGGPPRRTSTTRTDTGNGACETVVVKDFEILTGSASGWRTLMWSGLALALLSVLAHLARPIRRGA